MVNTCLTTSWLIRYIIRLSVLQGLYVQQLQAAAGMKKGSSRMGDGWVIAEVTNT